MSNNETYSEINGRLDEFQVRDKLKEDRKNIKTSEQLMAFIKDVEENYNYDYGVAPRAIAQACLAVGWYLSGKMGITGFQAGCTMWDFIRDWVIGGDSSTGLKLVNYDEMLYPQYDYKFEKTICRETWESLQKEAAKLLEKGPYAPVAAHWKSIVDGIVPFGYTIKD